jgi:hypothetical protein
MRKYYGNPWDSSSNKTSSRKSSSHRKSMRFKTAKKVQLKLGQEAKEMFLLENQ